MKATRERNDHSVLVLPKALAAELGVWARQGYPHETCGLLIGRTVASDVIVANVVKARNLNTERARDRFELDPEDWIAADLEARTVGHEIVGIWHSHPDHPAQPSATDLARAWQCYSYVIASVTSEGLAEMRSWRLDDGAFIEESIQEESTQEEES